MNRKLPIAFKREIDIRFSILQYLSHVRDSIRLSRYIIGFDPDREDGFNLIMKDSRSEYRIFSRIKHNSFLRIKYIFHNLYMFNIYYRDVFIYG